MLQGNAVAHISVFDWAVWQMFISWLLTTQILQSQRNLAKYTGPYELHVRFAPLLTQVRYEHWMCIFSFKSWMNVYNAIVFCRIRVVYLENFHHRAHIGPMKRIEKATHMEESWINSIYPHIMEEWLLFCQTNWKLYLLLIGMQNNSQIMIVVVV